MIGGKLMTTATFTGPNTNITISSGTAGTITLSLSGVSGARRISDYLGLLSITGLPAGVVVTGFEIDATKNEVTVFVYNTSGSDVTVTAGSVTATAVVLAY